MEKLYFLPLLTNFSGTLFISEIGTIYFSVYTYTCPIHDDTSKNSMRYYPDSNTVHCFGACSKTYNSISLMAAYRGISPKEAFAELQSRYGLKPRTPEEEEWQYKLQLMDKLISDAEKNLAHEQKEALHARGVTEETIKNQRIGYMPENPLEGCGLTEEELKDLGVLYHVGSELASNFADKIIVPLYDRYSNLAYLVAWNYKGIEGEPKYATPKNFKRSIVGDKVDGAVLVEGVFDLIIMQHAGYKACSFLGVSPTKQHLDELKGLRDIKIMFDADEAGRKQAEELAKQLYPEAQIIRLPEV